MAKLSDGYYILTPATWPVPIKLEVRRWHADNAVTQVSFAAGWAKVPDDAWALVQLADKALQQIRQDPGYANFRKHHGNLVLYMPAAEQIKVTDEFEAYCKGKAEKWFPGWRIDDAWRYSGNGLGWTCLLREARSEPEH